VERKKYKSGPSGRHRTPRVDVPVPGNPLERMVVGACEANRAALAAGPRTVVELARASGVVHATLAAMLSGRRRLTDEVAEKVAPVLGLDADAVKAAGAEAWAMRPGAGVQVAP